MAVSRRQRPGRRHQDLKIGPGARAGVGAAELTGRPPPQGRGPASVGRRCVRGGRRSEAASGGGIDGVDDVGRRGSDENCSRRSGGRAGENLGLRYETTCSSVMPGTFVG
jgi:hypothetical protein